MIIRYTNVALGCANIVLAIVMPAVLESAVTRRTNPQGLTWGAGEEDSDRRRSSVDARDFASSDAHDYSGRRSATRKLPCRGHGAGAANGEGGPHAPRSRPAQLRRYRRADVVSRRL